MKPEKPKCSLPIPTVAPGVKLAKAPIDYLVLLLFVTLVEQRRNRFSAVDAANQTGISSIKINRAVSALATNRLILRTKLITLSEFEFSVPLEVVAALRQPARSYREHLKAKAARASDRKVRDNLWQASRPAVAKLPPVAAEVVAAHMAGAAVQAERLKMPLKADKIAVCMARFGAAEIVNLVDHVIATHTKKSLKYHFFAEYTSACNARFGTVGHPMVPTT